MHSMVSEQTVLLNMQFWILSTEYKVIWRQVCTRAAYLLIQKKPLTKLTILYYYANWVNKVYVELSMIVVLVVFN